MSKFLRAGLAGMALALVFNVLAVGEGNAQGIISEILTRMHKHSKSLASLKADLKMVKDYPQIDETETYVGAIALLLPTERRVSYTRIDWEKPRVESIALIGESFEIYVPALKTITRGTASKISEGGSGVFSFLTMSKSQMKENYIIDYLGQEGLEGTVQTWHLRVTPKNRTAYKAIDIWVDGDGMPFQVMQTGHNYSARQVKFERLGLTPAIMAMVKRTEEETGLEINCDIAPLFEFAAETTTLRISNLRKNVMVEGSIFKINVPKGTKVIKG